MQETKPSSQQGPKMKSLEIMENYEALGIIPAFDTELSLTNLRREIEDDFEINDFDFKQNETGQQTNTQEEAVIKVVSIMQIPTTNEVPIINITKRLPNPFKSSCINITKRLPNPFKSTTNTSKKSTCTTETVSVSPGVASFQNVSTNTNFLRSPTSWEMRGVKVYTEEEIARAKGMERKHRLFWNAEAKKLC